MSGVTITPRFLIVFIAFTSAPARSSVVPMNNSNRNDIGSAAEPTKCLMDAGLRSRDEAPIASLPVRCRDRAQNLRRPFQRSRQRMPAEVRPRVASLGEIRVASVVFGYFAAHYNIRYRPAFPRSSGPHFFLECAK